MKLFLIACLCLTGCSFAIVDYGSMQDFEFTFPGRGALSSTDKTFTSFFEILDGIMQAHEFRREDATDGGRFFRIYRHEGQGISVTVRAVQDGFGVYFGQFGPRTISKVARDTQTELTAKMRRTFGDEIHIAEKS